MAERDVSLQYLSAAMMLPQNMRVVGEDEVRKPGAAPRRRVVSGANFWGGTVPQSTAEIAPQRHKFFSFQ